MSLAYELMHFSTRSSSVRSIRTSSEIGYFLSSIHHKLHPLWERAFQSKGTVCHTLGTPQCIGYPTHQWPLKEGWEQGLHSLWRPCWWHQTKYPRLPWSIWLQSACRKRLEAHQGHQENSPSSSSSRWCHIISDPAPSPYHARRNCCRHWRSWSASCHGGWQW